ncbi:hypothetical protein [Streptomyces canus]
MRATLFSLGALMFLVDAGLNRRVSEITSVSGGSITNAYVAQRRDFTAVTASEFDVIAQGLVRRVTQGLVSRRVVIAVYGLTGLAVLTVVIGWPVDLPWPVDVLLVAVYGAGLLVRGMLLTWMLDAKLFRGRGLPRRLGEMPAAAVNHVFCSTDLDSTLPFYLSTRHPFLYSPKWGAASSEQSAQLSVTTAVRASAAFPGGVPPKRLATDQFGLKRTTPQLTAWLEARGREMRPEDVGTLYLEDGGVWNNLGTDWFEADTQAFVAEARGLDSAAAKRVIAIDATPPPPVATNLWYLRYPWLAEVLGVFRVLQALYASTIASRVTQLASPPDGRGTEEGSPLLVRMISPLRIQVDPVITWRGDDKTWSGRSGAWWRISRLWSNELPWASRKLSALPAWSAHVPTTLFRIPPEIALQLVLHGYLATSEAVSGPVDADDVLPGLITRIAATCDVQVKVSAHHVYEVSRRGRFADATEASARDLLVYMESADQIIKSLENTVPRVEGDLLKGGKEPVATAEMMHVLKRAHTAMRQSNFEEAAGLYKEAFLSSVLAEVGRAYLTANDMVNYARCLTATGDANAQRAALLVEDRMLRTGAHSDIWYSLATVYATQGNAEAAVRCLEHWEQREAPGSAARLLRYLDIFSPIRNTPAVVAYLSDARR